MAASGVEADAFNTAAVTHGELKSPSAPCPDTPAADLPPLAEAGTDAEPAAQALHTRLRRSAWVSVVPLWPSDALRWQRLEPSLRLNPGHAPPYA